MTELNIVTKYLGDITIEDGQVINFPSGIPGFLEEKEFVLLNIPGNPVFQFLQSIHSSDLAFIVTNPYHFYTDYTVKLDDSTIESLQIESEKDVLIATIVTLKEPFDASTINLKAPIIINQKKMLGKQFILNSDDYESKASIKPAVTREGV
ncbi:flagellar assembly protein FliW [Ornithinibacillus californiensis]|uniref:flagellar assembly protein FliW n=1 Tax=Ornithinibacillus californiensis TaxID=161536 RepID=UPI002E8061B1|nr:flagellar assembly protein FliW [Ornithinibacillus californiensis]